MSSDTSAPSGHTKEFIVLMASMMSVVAISIDALLPALGVVVGDLQLTNPNHAQYLIGFIFAGMALGQLFCGPLSDALGRKKALFLGIAFYLIGSVVCYVAQDLTTMLVGRFIQGVGVSGPYISAISIVRDKFSGRQMAKIMSVVMMIFILVPAIAPSLGQAIMLYASWRYIFVLYIIYAITVALWVFLRQEETLPPEHRIPFTFVNFIHGFKEVVGNRGTFFYTICMGICFGSFMGYLTSSQQIFQDQFGVGEAFSLYFGALALVLGSASLLNSRFVVKYGMFYICVRSFAVIVVASVVFLAAHFITDEITLWMFLVYAAFLFFCFGLVFGNLNALAMEPMGHIAGMASAIIGATSSVMSWAIGSTIGQLYNGTLVPIVSGFLIFGLLSLLALYCARRG